MTVRWVGTIKEEYQVMIENQLKNLPVTYSQVEVVQGRNGIDILELDEQGFDAIKQINLSNTLIFTAYCRL